MGFMQKQFFFPEGMRHLRGGIANLGSLQVMRHHMPEKGHSYIKGHS